MPDRPAGQRRACGGLPPNPCFASRGFAANRPHRAQARQGPPAPQPQWPPRHQGASRQARRPFSARSSAFPITFPAHHPRRIAELARASAPHRNRKRGPAAGGSPALLPRNGGIQSLREAS